MAYHKYTLISGYNTPEECPRGIGSFAEINAFMNAHWKSTTLNGHWKPEAALALATRMGIVAKLNIEHHVSDTSGRGRGGIDRRWTMADGRLVESKISADEDQDAALQDASDVHDAWDAVDGI